MLSCQDFLFWLQGSSTHYSQTPWFAPWKYSWSPCTSTQVFGGQHWKQKWQHFNISIFLSDMSDLQLDKFNNQPYPFLTEGCVHLGPAYKSIHKDMDVWSAAFSDYFKNWASLFLTCAVAIAPRGMSFDIFACASWQQYLTRCHLKLNLLTSLFNMTIVFQNVQCQIHFGFYCCLQINTGELVINLIIYLS